MSEFVNVGPGWYVRRSEIVAVHDGAMFHRDNERMAVIPWDLDVRCVIQLRDGHPLPCYVTATTLMRRLEEAERDGS